MKRPDAGRVMAYALLAGGTLATVAANYAHAEPHFGARALSAVIPVLLFGAFHVAAYDGRWFIRTGTGIVALVCFGISYDHISALALKYGESDLSAVLYPLGIDGAMIVATFVLSRSRAVEDKEEDKPTLRLSGTVRPRPVAVPRVAHALSSDPKPAALSAPVEDKPVPPKDKPVREIASRADEEDRLTAAREIADELGALLSRTSLVRELKERGFAISTNAAAALTRELKASRS